MFICRWRFVVYGFNVVRIVRSAGDGLCVKLLREVFLGEVFREACFRIELTLRLRIENGVDGSHTVMPSASGAVIVIVAAAVIVIVGVPTTDAVSGV